MMAVRIVVCPVCRHSMEDHDDDGRCLIKDCWCRYNADEEDVEVE